MSKREKAMERARKLMSLAMNNESDAEASLAMAQAQSIMFEFDLTEAMIAESDGDDESSEDNSDEEVRVWEEGLEGSRTTWRSKVVRALAKANGCDYYVCKGETRRFEYRLVGRVSDVESVRYFFQVVAREIDKRAKAMRGNGSRWMREYREGMAETVAQDIRSEMDVVADRLRAEAASASALVVVNKAVARIENKTIEARTWAQRKLRLSSAGSTRAASSGSTAFQQGRRDGAGAYGGKSNGARIGSGTIRQLKG